MNFGFTEEQDLLRQEVRKFLDAHCPLPEVRHLMETPEGFSRDLWKQIGELGWLGLTIPEAHGGAGLGWVDLVVVLEETGRTLFPSPFLATTIAAAAIREAGTDTHKGRWLPALADGSKIASLAWLEPSDRWEPAGVELSAKQGKLTGTKIQVLDAPAADLFVVAFRQDGALRFGVVERNAPGVAVEPTPSIDQTRRVGRVRLDGAPIADVLEGAGDAVATRILDLATAAATAESLGAAEAAIRLTVAYANEREQFGSPIGRFQGVKHPLAEAFVDVESAKSIVYYAAWCLDERDADASRAVSLAKAYASESFPRVGIDAVQLHGGVGFTWEYDPHLYLKRSKWARAAFGDADFHYDRAIAMGEQ